MAKLRKTSRILSVDGGIARCKQIVVIQTDVQAIVSGLQNDCLGLVLELRNEECLFVAQFGRVFVGKVGDKSVDGIDCDEQLIGHRTKKFAFVLFDAENDV